MRKPVRQLVLAGSVMAMGLAVVLLWIELPGRLVEAEGNDSDAESQTGPSVAPDSVQPAGAAMLQDVSQQSPR